jgi:hypothetical protein
MLGCYGLFLHDKLMMLLRERENNPEFNGVFVATQPEFFDHLSNKLHYSNMSLILTEHHTHGYLLVKT